MKNKVIDKMTIQEMAQEILNNLKERKGTDAELKLSLRDCTLLRAMASEGNQANSKPANCAIFGVSGTVLIPDAHSDKNLILARAINYILDDVQEDGNMLAKGIVEELITLLDKQ